MIDEMINFYPKPFDIPKEMKDILSYVDRNKTHFGKSGKDIGGGFYKHRYHDLDSMKAAYSSSSFRLFSGRNGLNEYKTEYIMRHVLSNGLDTRILGRLRVLLAKPVLSYLMEQPIVFLKIPTQGLFQYRGQDITATSVFPSSTCHLRERIMRRGTWDSLISLLGQFLT